MNHGKPPALATWVLDHLRSGVTDEALSGDLLEAFCAGRSGAWYWYQVIAAIAISWGRNLWHRRGILFFAAVWSVFSPAWRLIVRLSTMTSFAGYSSLAPWPWSFLSIFIFAAVAALVFIWLGIAVYWALHLLAFGKLFLRSVRKSLLWGFAAYALSQTCMLAIDLHYPQPAGHASLSLLGVVAWKTLLRFPYFIATATTLWFLASRDKPEQVRAA